MRNLVGFLGMARPDVALDEVRTMVLGLADDIGMGEDAALVELARVVDGAQSG